MRHMHRFEMYCSMKNNKSDNGSILIIDDNAIIFEIRHSTNKVTCAGSEDNTD